MGVESMRCSNRGKWPFTKVLAALMIVTGLLILLFCVPYWFWAAVIGLALTVLGIILWNS